MKSGNAEEYKGYLQVFVGGIFWGTIGLFVKLLEQCGSDATFSSFLRMLFSYLIMVVITALKEGLSAFKIDRRTFLACAIMGFLCQALNGLLYNVAIVYVGVAFSSIIMNVATPFTAILSCFIFSEKIIIRKKIAILINFLGCTLLATDGKIGTVNVIWIAALLISALACSLMPIIGKVIGTKCSVYVMSSYNYFFAAIFLGICVRPHRYLEVVNEKMILIGFLYALIGTVIAYLFYYLGVQKIKESSKVPVIASVETVVSVLIGVLIYHESVKSKNAIGMLLVMSSIVLMNYKFKKEPVKP